MGRTSWSMIAVLAIAAFCQAGDLKGACEVSVSAQFGQVNSSEKYTYHNQEYSDTYTDDVKATFLMLALRYGIFVTRNFEIAPELNWSAIENLEPAFNVAANLEYNFASASTSEKQRNVPFLLAGYGIGNAAPLYFAFYSRSSDKFDVPVLNLGAGLKTFVSDRVAVRFEYRYQRYTWDTSYNGYYSGYTSEYVDQYHRFLFGFSLFTPRRSAAGASDASGCGGCGMK